MQYTIKILITLAVVIVSTQIGKKIPSLAGLIATMPLTGLLALLWLYSDNPGDRALMVGYTRGAIFGIIPSVMFYLTALVCFMKGLSLGWTMSLSFAVWLAGAFVHQAFVR